MTIGVQGFGTDGQMDRMTEGQEIVIAGGERSVYRDSGWILSRIILIAGGRQYKFLLFREDDDRCTRIWDRMTEGKNIVIAGGERSVYRDSGWILSRIILIAGG